MICQWQCVALRNGMPAEAHAGRYQGSTDEAAFDYTWHWFELMRAFFRKTADEGRQIVFTADQ